MARVALALLGQHAAFVFGSQNGPFGGGVAQRARQLALGAALRAMLQITALHFRDQAALEGAALLFRGVVWRVTLPLLALQGAAFRARRVGRAGRVQLQNRGTRSRRSL